MLPLVPAFGKCSTTWVPKRCFCCEKACVGITSKEANAGKLLTSNTYMYMASSSTKSRLPSDYVHLGVNISQGHEIPTRSSRCVQGERKTASSSNRVRITSCNEGGAMAEAGLKLLHKVAIITGAGNGIGAATAQAFAKFGATLALLDINEKSLKNVAAQCENLSSGQPKPLLFVGNIGDNEFRKKSVEDAVKKFAKLDVLVNNAGITKLTRLLSSPLEDYDAIFDINVRSLIHMTQLAAPHLIKTKGSIINMSSITSHRVYDGRLFYGMSKAAVKRFTEYAAQELGPYQVRVNSISPGVIKTNIFLNYNVTKDELPKYVEEAGKKHALQRCGEPSEVADVIAFLASSESSFITGTDILIDGGCSVMASVGSQVEGK